MMELGDNNKGSQSRSRSRSKLRSSGANHCSTNSEIVASKSLLNDSNLNKLQCKTRSILFEKYDETWAALNNLQDSLGCHNNCQANNDCQDKQKELFSLGVCEHRFCRLCVESNVETLCPVCSMPYRSTNVHIDKQLSNISSLCTNLFNILAGKPNETENGLQAYDFSALKENRHDEKNKSIDTQVAGPELEDAICEENIETGRGRKRSDKFISQKQLPLEKAAQETPRKSQRGREKISSVTPNNSCNKIRTPGKVKKPKEETPKAESSNIVQDVHQDTYNANERLDKPEEKERTMQPQMTPNKKNVKNHMRKQKKVNSPSPACKKYAAEQGTCNAVGRGNIAILEKRNAKGETPLQVAAVKANFKRVQELLAEGANPNVKDNAGWTPLHEAVNHGNTRITEILLDHGASVNAPGLENDTPLHDAVTTYSLECVQLLVKRGANVLARNIHGQTALDLAKTEDMREALLVPDGTTIAPEKDTFMEQDICGSGRLCFVMSSLSKEQLVSVRKCAKLLDSKLVENHCSEVTHSINSVNAEGLCPRTLKYLTAILNGAWIVSAEWNNECLKQNRRVAEENFEVNGCVTRGVSKAPQKARLNRLKKLPGLFDGCQFFFHGKFQYPTPSKEDLIQLAKLGGGVILSREPRLYNLDDYPYTVPYHATSASSLSDCAIFVIYDDSCPNPPQVKAQRMTYLPASWLLDSIASFTILEKTDYLKF